MQQTSATKLQDEESGVRKRIRIFDTTLRDGEQTPGVSLTVESKVEIAKALDRLGVDVIEAGFPIVSDGEFEAVKRINKLRLSAQVAALSRVDKKDIDKLIDCDISYGHLFIATSDLHLEHKLKITREKALESAIQGIEYARAHGIKVEFSAEDATRTAEDFLVNVFREAERAGAERINVPDTVGTMTPEKFADLIAYLKTQIGIPISVHCHDDYGLAVANSLAGVKAGADQAHLTINGLGERAGNASLEEFVMAASRLYNIEFGINTKLLYETSRIVSRLTRVLLPPNKAIVGENAFGHESGIHTHGVLNMPATYEPMAPELVGARRRIQAGKHAGTHGIYSQLKALGIEVSPENLKKIIQKVKEIGDQGKTVTDTDLDRLAREISGVATRNSSFRITDLAIVTGINTVPTASVRLSYGNNESASVAQTGVGPVDAVLKAIQQVTDRFARVSLREYRIEAVSGGTDAEAEVLIKIEDDRGNVCSASATGQDIVMASVSAMVSGINEILLRRSRGESDKVESLSQAPKIAAVTSQEAQRFKA
ncbi:MAG: 2-isopropylmalate synthase [archaeon]|nr:2-isopropylmalate synthase [archaeon]